VILELSDKVCTVCGRLLRPSEVRINELSRRGPSKRIRYVCSNCRKIEYEQYQKAVRELIEKK